jgi:hypothetical protein
MNMMLAEWFDSASLRLREALGELEGVSPETLQRIDHISRYQRRPRAARPDVYAGVSAAGLAGARRERPGRAAGGGDEGEGGEESELAPGFAPSFAPSFAAVGVP